MSEGITIARVYFGCGIVSTVDRLNNTTRRRRHECVPQRMFAWLPINTMLRVPYRTDSDTVSVTVRSNANKGIIHIFNTQLSYNIKINIKNNPLDSFQNNSRNQVSVTRSQFAYPERMTCPGRLLSEWVEVTLSGSASSQ